MPAQARPGQAAGPGPLYGCSLRYGQYVLLSSAQLSSLMAACRPKSFARSLALLYDACTITNTTRSGPSAEWLVGWLDGLKNVGRGTRSRPPGLLARLSPDPV